MSLIGSRVGYVDIADCAVGDASASRNWKFESIPLQQRVCELSVPECPGSLLHPPIKSSGVSAASTVASRSFASDPDFSDR
jgi:hypothetical protein